MISSQSLLFIKHYSSWSPCLAENQVQRYAQQI